MRFRLFALLVVVSLVARVFGANAEDGSVFMTRQMPYAASDRLPEVPVDIGAANLDVRFSPGDFSLPRETILDWLKASARAVSIYYGRFPVSNPRVLIVPVPGRGVQGGQAFGYRGPAIRLLLGQSSTEADLKADWKAVHEMVHLALPDVGEVHLWLAEGLAVYVESIARVQAGDLTEEKIWGDFLRDMPLGLPAAGDRGLDFTHTWGRTYWGGAIFCLLSDVELRKRTHNALGLEQAMRGVLAAGGTHDRVWPIERILKTADDATGLNVLAELYAKMRAAPSAPDLDALWLQLGVSRDGGTVVFDDSAPLAPLRKAIVAKRRASKDSDPADRSDVRFA